MWSREESFLHDNFTVRTGLQALNLDPPPLFSCRPVSDTALIFQHSRTLGGCAHVRECVEIPPS